MSVATGTEADSRVAVSSGVVRESSGIGSLAHSRVNVWLAPWSGAVTITVDFPHLGSIRAVSLRHQEGVVCC